MLSGGEAALGALERLPAVAGEVPSTFRENSSQARRLSAGATTD
jgi:hypothetical protein